MCQNGIFFATSAMDALRSVIGRSLVTWLLEKKVCCLNCQGWMLFQRFGIFQMRNSLDLYRLEGILNIQLSWRTFLCVLFVKEGDNNTCFFHRLANSHRSANQINNIEVDGVVYEDEIEVHSQVVHFYQVLYQETEMQ